ncbi:MAG: outer membrane beta-barrel protein [Cryomorphaceae bacterium]|nr:outer membrane beta-barrel protein [Cryomorphaceae bacterium]
MLWKPMWNKFIVFVLLLCSPALNAQVKFDGGVFAGGSITQVDGDNAQGFNKLGLSVGAFVQVNPSEKFGVRLEMGYIGKGSRRPANPDNNDFQTWGYNFRYINVPVLADFSFEKFDIIVGPYMGYLISDSQMFNNETFDIVNPEMSKTDFGGVVGAEMDFGDNIFFASRYSMSLIPIRPSPDSGNQVRWYDGGMSNIAVEVLVGYKF